MFEPTDGDATASCEVQLIDEYNPSGPTTITIEGADYNGGANILADLFDWAAGFDHSHLTASNLQETAEGFSFDVVGFADEADYIATGDAIVGFHGVLHEGRCVPDSDYVGVRRRLKLTHINQTKEKPQDLTATATAILLISVIFVIAAYALVKKNRKEVIVHEVNETEFTANAEEVSA